MYRGLTVETVVDSWTSQRTEVSTGIWGVEHRTGRCRFLPKEKKEWPKSSKNISLIDLRQLKSLLPPAICPSPTARMFNQFVNCCIPNIVLMPTKTSGGSPQRDCELWPLRHWLTSNLEGHAAGADYENGKNCISHSSLSHSHSSVQIPNLSELFVFSEEKFLSLSWSTLGLPTVCSYLLHHSTPAPRLLSSPLPSCSLSVGIIARKRQAQIQAECDQYVL